VAHGDVTQARVGVQGRFLDASGSTLQPKYSPIGGAAQRRLAARARRQTISAFEPLILPYAPLTNFGWPPRTKGNLRKFGRWSDSPRQNWEFGEGIPSPNKGAGIGNALEFDVTQSSPFSIKIWFTYLYLISLYSNFSFLETLPLNFNEMDGKFIL